MGDPIVTEFESIFGKLTATERKWLSDQIAPLRSALKPFGEAARHYAPYPADANDKHTSVTFPLGVLRAAQDGDE